MLSRIELIPLLALFLISCSPSSPSKNFGDRSEYKDFGPRSQPTLSQNFSFGQSFEELKLFRAKIPSSEIFDTVSNIFRAQQIEARHLKDEASQLAYKLYAKGYAIEKLNSYLDYRELKEKQRSKLQNLISSLKYRDAWPIKVVRAKLKSILTEAQFQSYSKLIAGNRGEELLSLANSLRSYPFLSYPAELEIRQKLIFELEKEKGYLDSGEELYSETEKFIEKLRLRPEIEPQSELLLSKAVKLEDSFYQETKNYSSYAVDESAYIETALGLYGADVFQTWTEGFQNIRLQIVEAFKNVKLKIDEPTEEDYKKPENVVLNLHKQLSMLPDELLSLGVEALAVDQVKKQIAALDPLIFYVVERMTTMDRELRLKSNIALFDEVLVRLEEDKLFPEAVIETVKKEVRFPRGIQTLVDIIEQEGSSHELRLALSQTILVRIWRYLRAQVEADLEGKIARKEIRKCLQFMYRPMGYGGVFLYQPVAFSESCSGDVPTSSWDRFRYKMNQLGQAFGSRALVYGLAMLNEEDLDWMARVDENNLDLQESFWDYLDPIVVSISGIIKSSIEDQEELEEDLVENSYARVEPFIKNIEKSVNQAFLRKVAIRLSSELSSFDKIVEQTILKSIDAVDFGPRGFYTHLKGIAKAELSSKILDDSEGGLVKPLYESQIIETAFGLDSWNFRSPNPNPDSLRTGASAVTSSASAKTLGLWYLPGLKDSKSYRFEDFGSIKKRAFDLVNKLVSTLGYRNYFGSLKAGLVVNAKSRVPRKMDIYTYAYEEEYFGIPNEFDLNKKTNDFDLSLVSEERLFSVESNARLLQMSADFMELMADWKRSPLDDSLHKITYQDVSFFPKESLIELGLGLGSVTLRNLKKRGLRLFDKNRQEIVLNESTDTKELGARVMTAALVDVAGDSVSDQVSLVGMSRYMLALHDFISATETLGYSRSNSMIYLSSETGESVRVELKSAIDLLRKLYVGMANFLSSRMLNDRFQFFENYNLSSNTASVLAGLKGQNLARTALLKASQMWGADIYLWAAVDNYRSTKSRFLNTQNGLLVQQGVWAPAYLSGTYLALSELSAVVQIKEFLSEDEYKQLEKIIGQHKLALIDIL